MRSLWNRVLFDFIVWRAKQKLRRAHPELRDLDAGRAALAEPKP